MFNIGNFTVTIMEIVVILMILLFLVHGLRAGFVGQLFGLIGTIVVIAGAVLLAGAVGQLLNGIMGDLIRKPIENWVGGMGEEVLLMTGTEVGASIESLEMVLGAIGIPAIAAGLLHKPLSGVFTNMGDVPLGTSLTDMLTKWAWTAIAFILLIIVFTIILLILRKSISKAVNRIRIFGSINRILGMVVGLAKAYFIISVFLAIVLIVPANWPLMGTLNEQISNSWLTFFLYKNNWIGAWLIAMIK